MEKNKFWQVFKKFIPLIVLAILMLTAYFTGITKFFTFDSLKNYHKTLNDFVAAHPFSAPLLFMAVYLVSTALSLPGGAILSLAGGFLFPFPLSSLYVVVAASLGACVIFLLAKTTFGNLLKQKAGPFMQKMDAGFSQNTIGYLLFLSFVTLFPFWLVNLAPAFFGVRLWTFFWTTFVGIIPGSIVFTQAGSGLASIFETNQELSLSTIFTTKIKIALALLGVFALLPMLIKRFVKKFKSKND